MGTMMACMGPGDRLLNGWLSQAASAQLEVGNPNRLVFFDQNDSRLGYMVRNAAVEPFPQEPVMPTGDPFLPGPVKTPNPDDWNNLADPGTPMPDNPEPRPLNPELPNSPRTESDGGIPTP